MAEPPPKPVDPRVEEYEVDPGELSVSLRSQFEPDDIVPYLESLDGVSVERAWYGERWHLFLKVPAGREWEYTYRIREEADAFVISVLPSIIPNPRGA